MIGKIADKDHSLDPTDYFSNQTRSMAFRPPMTRSLAFSFFNCLYYNNWDL